MQQAYVIGSGPNGLAAAIVLAQAGLAVQVFEAEAEPGGAARTLPLTLPGFLHDFGSAVHPLAAGSPFFSALPLANYGLEWVHGEAPLAHPFDDGSAVVLERDLGETEKVLGADGRPWRSLIEPIAAHWAEFAQESLGPLLRLPRHPLRMARFGLTALEPAQKLALSRFSTARARALFAGLAAHSFLALDQPFSAAVGLVLAAAAHAVGWPVPRGGASSIPRALLAHLESLGGALRTSCRIDTRSLHELDGEHTLTLCDIAPRQLISLAGERLTARYRRTLDRFQPGPGAFKIDFALSEPVPWRAPECRRAICVHLGGTLEEIAASEDEVARGRTAERPFVLAAQPTLFDPSRAPEGKHVFWAYCHVPNGSAEDMTVRIEAQIERFAPGFRDCVLARRVLPPAALESMDANLLGGDISGGALTLRQILFRPGIFNYATSAPNLYLCSASTPPGGGVHGMCGFHAATLALRRMRRSK
ncbi:MAG TPA: NAD(P)/FAD-dependent oxidoreductase [Terracidiphilus sp.]|nr:NAD(P)/FAD-dependent oxidoreductase [Terracidiphilus sp.]